MALTIILLSLTSAQFARPCSWMCCSIIIASYTSSGVGIEVWLVIETMHILCM